MSGKPTDMYCGLTQARLKEAYNYDSETGFLTRKVDCGTRWRRGEIVGTIQVNGYRSVSLGSRRFLAHRLIWLYVFGRWPAADIDHINRNRDDNRISNLREATRGQNNINSKVQHNNTSGYKGAYYDRRRKCWYAEIWVNNQKIFLGRYETAANAGAAYLEAAKKYFGEFARAA